MQDINYSWVSVGIDPGYSGAVATIEYHNDGSVANIKIVELKEYFYKVKKLKTKQIHYGTLIHTLHHQLFRANGISIERVKAMPRDGGTSAFNFGYVTGVLRGIVECKVESSPNYITVLNPTPQLWKSSLGLKTGATKQDSVNMASRCFPEHKKFFYGPRGGLKDGVAEAVLLAMYGFRTRFDITTWGFNDADA